MTKDEIIELGMRKRNGEIAESWNELLLKHKDLPFKNGDCFRKYIGRHINVRQESNVIPLENSKENELLRLQKERVKFRDERNNFRKEIRNAARYENLVDVLKNSIQDSNLPRFNIDKHNKSANTSNDCIVACLSDVHYGINIDNAFNTYNPEICKERLEHYTKKIIEIADNHSVNNLIVLGLGDYISGELHKSLIQYNQVDSITQIQNVSELICNMLYELDRVFVHVSFASIQGNHGRIDDKDKSIYEANLDKIMWWYAKARLSSTDVEFIENDYIDSVITLKKYNRIFYGVHGDIDKTKRIISDLSLMTKEFPDEIFMGHLHHFSVDSINDITLNQCGCLCGADTYSLNIRKASPPCQTIKVFAGEDEIIYNVKLT